VDQAIACSAVHDWTHLNSGKAPVAALAGDPALPKNVFPPGSQVIDPRTASNDRLGSYSRRHMESAAAFQRLEVTSVDLVIADGVLNECSFPAGCLGFCTEFRRVLRAGGRCIIRCFAQRQNREAKEEVFADLSRGAVGSFNAFIVRLAMAIQPSPEAGITEAQIWDVVHEMWSSAERLAACHGWPIQEVGILDSFQSSSRRYAFPTVTEFERIFADCGFTIRHVLYPVYELGERCPTIVMEPRPANC
jgi:hypothetical protein